MTNKFFTLIPFLFTLNLMCAQEVTNKSKSFILGGSVNFSLQKNSIPFRSQLFLIGNESDSKSSYFNASSYIGNQINHHLALGIAVDFFASKYTYNAIDENGEKDMYEQKSNQYGFNIFGRYAFYPEKTFDFYVQPYAGYNLIHNYYEFSFDKNEDNVASYFKVGFGIGMLYNINNSWRLTIKSGGINYINGSWKATETAPKEKFSEFQTSLNLSSFSFGIELKL